ncbi:MAG: MFS transporter [Armatimonadetes bacterium]|nr:MFS transporter [Armatimonadota bacterium]
MAVRLEKALELLRSWPAFRVFRHADFRLLWFGALISFTGSQIQMVAQGAYVYEVTGRKTALALVAVFGMLPVTILSPVMGAVVDLFDRRKIIILTSIALFLATAYNAYGASTHTLTIMQIYAVALIGGFVQTVEPTSRQTIVREVVGDQDLAQAVPLQAMTFNIAKSIGPAIGGILTSAFGFATCFWANSISFLAMTFAAMAIKTKTEKSERRPQPIKDLIFEGMLFTMRNPSLRMLFLMEGALSLFGMPYFFQMPAIAKDFFHLDEAGLGVCYTANGLGALTGLITIATLSVRPIKTRIVRYAMSTFAVALAALCVTRNFALALPLFAILGACSISMFNTTNTLFQLISPGQLRGRVLSMHLWAIAGLAPLGNLWMGWIADAFGLPVALGIGGACVAAGAVLAFANRKKLIEPVVVSEPVEREGGGAR